MIEHLIKVHTDLENLSRSAAPIPDEAMNSLVDAIYAVRRNILAELGTSGESVPASIFAPFIGHMVADGA